MENAGKYLAMNVNGISAFSSSQRGPMHVDKPQIFAEAAETVFLLKKSKFQSTLKIKYQQFNIQ
jgi:hypothetical protein